MTKSFTILVLCRANICRSPIAAAIFSDIIKKKHLLGNVSSAGLFARWGIKPHRFAVQALERLGYEIEPYKLSHQVSQPALRAADLILVMEKLHRRHMQRISEVSGKTFLLGHWQDIEIVDPIGKDFEFFVELSQKIEMACSAWMQHIEQSGLIS